MMNVRFEGKNKAILVEGEADMAEISTLLVESASYEAQMVRQFLSELETGQKPVTRHALLGIQPWIDRLDQTLGLLGKVLE